MIPSRDMIFNGPDGRMILRKAKTGQRAYPSIEWILKLAHFCASMNFPPPHVVIVAADEWERLQGLRRG